MGIDLGVHEQVQGRPRRSIHRALRPLLMALVLTGAFGCEARREHDTTADGGGDSTVASTESRASAPRKRSTGERRSSGGQATSEAGSAERDRSASTTPAPAGANHVRLIQRGCVQFEPQWTTIQVGQTLTWHSELGVPVTIHLPAGAFEATEFIVRAGQSLTTGPARAAGAYPITSQPNACQGAPLGPRGSSPGVTIAAGR
jgi:plastocyanin